MHGFQKRILAGAAAALLASAAMVGAQPSETASRLDELFVELADPERTDWARVEAEIQRLWSRSGSPSMDLLLRRAGEAMEAENFELAVEHLSALTEQAPDFAEGWNARATAFFMLGEHSLALADIERTLALNPRHFGALEGLGAILEEFGELDLAVAALRAAHAINPNRPSVQESIDRLERATGATEL